MIVLALASLLVGAALGLRFTALILLPATVFAVSAVLVIGPASLLPLSTTAFEVVLAWVCLQFGYLMSNWALSAIVSARAVRGERRWPARPACVR